MRKAIYAGTFDPVTNGHLDVIKRACHIFDKIVVTIANNPHKKTLFSLEERMKLIQENLSPDDPIELASFDGLVVDFAKKIGAIALIRGLRAVSDFDFEFQMTQMNRRLDSDIETIFLMPTQKYFFTSSGLVKEVSRYTDKANDLTPPNVTKALKKHFGRD